jgi:RNA polymerase sigma-70 factor (ECF subfamily)
MILAYLPSVSTHLIEAERNQRLKCAIRELGEELQACVVLYYGHDWSVREVSEFLNLPNTTVKWRLHEARRQLRHRLTDLLENES